MPHRPLRENEIEEVLAREQVVRVAFHAGDDHYLIPLGYVLLGKSLCGVTNRGRKTSIAESEAAIEFQVDTSSTTGLYEWRSVTGRGEFRIVTDDPERREVLLALQPLIEEAPDWWRDEQAPRLAAGDFEVWRITPTETCGRSFGPPRVESP